MSGVSLSFEKAREWGILWALNKIVMHPRGFAIGWRYPEDASEEEIIAHGVEPIGIVLLGNGSEPWTFSDDLDNAGFEAFEALLATRKGGG